LSVKHRPDDEVLELLRQHDVPDDLTLEAFYRQVEQQQRHSALAGRRRLTAGQIAESFARTFGFSHWTTFRYLLKRRDKLRERQQRRGGEAPVIPEQLAAGQQEYLKKLRYRKVELVRVELDGADAVITHRTAAGNLISYRVDARGNARYVSPGAS